MAFIALLLTMVAVGEASGGFRDWLANFGHDTFVYPDWVVRQMDNCTCVHSQDPVSGRRTHDCYYLQGAASDKKKGERVDYKSEGALTFCLAKQWLFEHMPEFDKNYLPPAVSVHGKTMLDDNIAFALMADQGSVYSASLSLELKLHYILPYASYHESRTNWRPLLFAKLFSLVENTTTTHEAMVKLASPSWGPKTPPAFTHWTKNIWDSYPLKPSPDQEMSVRWASSTSPPVSSPFDFAAYGYGSCTAWATLLTYSARSVGIPARQVGTPCWNTGEFAGSARDNPNVTTCWHGGPDNKPGGIFLNNHNWVEYWSSEEQKWVFINDPPQNTNPDEGLCGTFSEEHGCDYSSLTGCTKATSGPSLAREDHPIFAISWTNQGAGIPEDGGEVIDVKNLRLTNGQEVSPLVWSPFLSSPLGEPLREVGLRVVNRTDFYRCKD